MIAILAADLNTYVRNSINRIVFDIAQWMKFIIMVNGHQGISVDLYILQKHKLIFPYNINEWNIGDSWRDSCELMSHLLKGCLKLLWCDCSDFL